ncbi:MAG: cytochrome c maturation protein CcmE [Bacteroidetes bacterium]|jgi:cytochrome c-type biogenesis protein CcmE|nr:cytochrome c maturation protein CcmE [Bacteroidota bacterium]
MKKGGIVALLVIAVAVAIMMVTLGDTSTYVTFQTAKDNPGVEFHVVGKLLAHKPQEYDPVKDPNYYSFYMADSLKNEMKVVYLDAKPIDIERAERVVVIGKAVNDSEFHAGTILQKCPSKYKDEGLVGTKSSSY